MTFIPDHAAQLAACREELLRIEREAKRDAYLDVWDYVGTDSSIGDFLKKRLKELNDKKILDK